MPSPHPTALALRRALAMDPTSRPLRAGLAALCLQQHREEEAHALLQDLAQEAPLADAEAYLFACACLATGRESELDGLLRGHPNEAAWCMDLGAEAGQRGLWSEAVPLLRRAHLLAPEDPEALERLCLALEQEGHIEEVLRRLAAFLEVRPARTAPLARLRLLLGENLMRQGVFEPGLRLLEARVDLPWIQGLPPLPLPPWDGGPVAGHTLLLRAEQGHGDAFQFIRYAQILAERGATVLVAPHPGTEDLMGTAPGVHGVITSGQAIPSEALQVPLSTLPRLCGTTLETLPRPCPYFRVPAQVPARKALDDLLTGLAGRKIGLVWAGNPDHTRDRERSLPPEVLDLLGGVPGVTWVSLQKEARALPALPLLDLAPHLGTFSDTAYALSRLDGLITVDTSVAHLAGALGRPTWLALARVPDCRWLLDRADTPWYPSLRLWRQGRAGDWATVVRDMAKELSSAPWP